MSRLASIKVGAYQSDEGKIPLGHLIVIKVVVFFSNYLASAIRYI